MVTAPATVSAGNALLFVVTAEDQFNNPVTAYSGTVHFASSDAQASLPATATITGGVGFFAAVLKTAGNQSITVADTAGDSGTSAAVAVSPLAANHFNIISSANAITGIAFNLTVQARDLFNNVVPTYGGTVHFTSNDAAAVLPSDSTLKNGVGVFSITLKSPGIDTITAADTVSSALYRNRHVCHKWSGNQQLDGHDHRIRGCVQQALRSHDDQPLRHVGCLRG